MPRQYIAQAVQSVSQVRFEVKGALVTGLIVNCEVSYGELGLNHQIDIWGDLTAQERGRAQGVYDSIKNKVESIILG